MGNRKYPPLKHSEMIAILVGLGFEKDRHGDHDCYERDPDAVRGRAVVPVDDYDEFDETLIKRMIPQTGFNRDQFYGASKVTARKAGVKPFKPCGKCGQQIGSTETCALCLSLRKA
jgi:predicted RNA binding protein YcfA (HicA-like mRNA interferase family)